MADSKISNLTNGSPSATGDALVVARSGASDKIILTSPLLQKLYDYTVTGADKASIDTNVDGTTVANFSGYDVLEVWLIARTDDAAAFHDVDMILNNDTAANYDLESVQAVGATASAGNHYGDTAWRILVHGTGGTAGYPGVSRIAIPGYAATVFNKVGEGIGATPDGTTGNDVARATIYGYRSTSAITRIKVAAQSTAKLKVGSRLIVYGR